MIYEEYEAIWSKIRNLEKKLFDFINKRDELFNTTQPKSPTMDKEIVDGKNPTNMMEQYLIQKEYLNEKILQLNITLDDLYQALKRKRDELKQSKHPYDKVYVYYHIEKLNVYQIMHLTYYSRSQIYKILEKFKHETK